MEYSVELKKDGFCRVKIRKNIENYKEMNKLLPFLDKDHEFELEKITKGRWIIKSKLKIPKEMAVIITSKSFNSFYNQCDIKAREFFNGFWRKLQGAKFSCHKCNLEYERCEINIDYDAKDKTQKCRKCGGDIVTADGTIKWIFKQCLDEELAKTNSKELN